MVISDRATRGIALENLETSTTLTILDRVALPNVFVVCIQHPVLASQQDAHFSATKGTKVQSREG